MGPREIVKEWPGLAKTGFDSVDTALQVPEDKAKKPGETYFLPSRPICVCAGHSVQTGCLAPPTQTQSPSPEQPASQPQPPAQNQPPTEAQPPKPPIAGQHMQRPMDRVGKGWFHEVQNVPVTGIEIWEGFWYAIEYWEIRKVQITWEDGHRRVFGTDLRAQRYNSFKLNPRGRERITNFTTRIGETEPCKHLNQPEPPLCGWFGWWHLLLLGAGEWDPPGIAPRILLAAVDCADGTYLGSVILGKESPEYTAVDPGLVVIAVRLIIH
ncbi:hypothetical protein BGW36DRAFT_450182 [Talaromyces proteolyticus]|uniref:Uncharacterized protein n=1 Tax=Talaromyces proteolyticus TaxID=1131652 RepID=A0AAD4KR90_9EURO|nr:uncharacterized protein BGW36DRAFT_450182 [Talaromyces proteolyticus]KAH8697511.1 hypothetical protein BGW36DRAFT_450182 [Talaromyces proteolyticus]